jgi:glycosyltransferase involved in cell wall biosynthesis
MDVSYPILYISYDGMLEPLGQSQVVCYLEKLSKDRQIILLSFEKSKDMSSIELMQKLSSRLSVVSVHWFKIRYHKSPVFLATLYDVCVGIVCSLWIIYRFKIKIVHARSYVPAVIALVLSRITKVRFIFDMRGFWADERVDGGSWQRNGLIFRLAKWFETKFLDHADHIISLTKVGIEALEQLGAGASQLSTCSVIPTCADLNRFLPRPALKRGNVIGYVGSVGRWYLFEPVAYCFSQLARIDSTLRFLILNQHEHSYIHRCLANAGVPTERVDVRSAVFDEMPNLISTMSASIFFTKNVFSVKASAPTKLAELLGCGVPCLTNTGVGDMAEQLAEQRCGITVSSFDTDALDAGVRALLELMDEPDIALRCRQTAERYFSLEEGVKRYAEVYASLGLTPKST